MIRKYIKGNRKQGFAVIKELKMLGGVNILGFDGSDEDSYYFIAKSGEITGTIGETYKELIEECFEEIILPPIFVSQEITFYTEPSSTCNGCCFDARYLRFSCSVAKTTDNKCIRGNFIYKQKQ